MQPRPVLWYIIVQSKHQFNLTVHDTHTHVSYTSVIGGEGWGKPVLESPCCGVTKTLHRDTAEKVSTGVKWLIN